MSLKTTDPEFIERFEHFALGEVVNYESRRLDTETRHIAILATLIGCGGVEAFGEMLEKALKRRLKSVSR